VKAAAFQKNIAIHGAKAAYDLKLVDKPPSSNIFASSWRSSSFYFGSEKIYLIGTSPRKMRLSDSKVGLAIRALWYLGKDACDQIAVSLACRPFNRLDREALAESVHLMPEWMRSCFQSLSG
jgi:hypothetical protein